MKNNESLNLYTREEIKKLLNMEERLVFVDDGIDEVIARFIDLADVIVDICRRFGYRNFKIYNFIEPTEEPIITTNGVYLDKCSPEDRQALIGRLVALQQYEEEIKNYKVISEEDLTYDEFIRLIDIVKNKFINSFGCFENDYEFVIRKKVNKPQKKKKESENVKDEK